jgi:hypothetical protein
LKQELSRCITPIFVLGSERNGTTWLCNILCQHPQIVGAQHKAHWGIHESFIYRHLRYWGDFGNDRNFITFLELYSTGDYFRLVEGDKQYFYNHRPESFVDFFLTLMDQYAQKHDAVYWTTKLDPSFYYRPKRLHDFISRLDQHYDGYKFIGIKRDFIPVLKSYLKMQGKAHQHRTWPLVRQGATCLETAKYAVHYDGIKKMVDRYNGLLLSFTDLKNNRKETVHRIVDFLDLDDSPNLLNDAYIANSSFMGRQGQNEGLSRIEAFLARKLLLPAFRHSRLGEGILKLRDLQKGNECPLFWRLLRLKYMAQSFSDELIQTEDIGLHEVLFGGEENVKQE